MISVSDQIVRLINGEASAFGSIQPGNTFRHSLVFFSMLEVISKETALSLLREITPNTVAGLYSAGGWIDPVLVGEREIDPRTYFWEPGLAVVIGVDSRLRIITIIERSNGLYTLRAKRFPIPH